MSKAPWAPRLTSPEDQRRQTARQLKDAREQVVYYRGKRLLATLRHERANFGALVLAWEMTAAALELRLERFDGGAAA